MKPKSGYNLHLATSQCSLNKNRGKTPETLSLPRPRASSPYML